jgi:NitT/TauT family transport system ATP-binding protein
MSADLTPVTIGFLPLLDAGLLMAAREEGFAAAEGLDLRLVREGSWAAVRDKLNAGLFDAAHMLAPAAVASTLGIGHLKVSLRAIAGLNLDGNAITVSNTLAARFLAAAIESELTPARSSQLIADIIAERAKDSTEPLTIGVVFGFSCHLYQVRRWLMLAGTDPEQAVRFVVIPPALMVESLALGQIDLFCAGAPWNRIAENQGVGRVLHACSSIIGDCPEKWLVMRENSLSQATVGALQRAIRKTADWCGKTANRPALARHLARPDYVGTTVEVIGQLLEGAVPTLVGQASTPWIRLDPGVVNITRAQTGLIHDMMRDAGHLRDDAAILQRIDAMVIAG